LPPLLEEVTAAVGGVDFVADSVGQGHLADLLGGY
jgi:hypothetical protein